MQVVGYKWRQRDGEWQPQLLLANGASLNKLWLWGAALSLELGTRRCVGFWSGAGWHPCPAAAEVQGTICQACKAADLYWLCKECVGACCMNEKVRPQCQAGEYFIYLASFGPLLKVGISRSRRFYERLIEQGADFGTKIAEVTDGLLVRAHEQKIARWLGIPDFVSGDTKAAALFSDPNAASVALLSTLARLRNSQFEFLSSPEIHDLRAFYRLGGIPRQPALLSLSEGARLKGEVIAAKGPVIILKDRFSYSAINIHRLVGREVRPLISLEAFLETAR